MILNALDSRKAAEQIRSAALSGYEHYVYGLVEAKDDNLFYVGKGKGNRAFDHLKLSEGNEFKNLFIEENDCRFFLFAFFTDAKDAFEYESAAIEHIGKHNLTNIGRGGLGQDPEFASAFAKQQWAEQGSKIRASVTSPEFACRMSDASNKMFQNPELKEKHSSAMRDHFLREYLSFVGKERMKDPAQRYKCGNGKRGVKQRQDVVDKRAETMRSVWSDPEYKERLRKKLRDATSSPEGRKQKFAAMMRHRVEKVGPPKSGYYGVEKCARRSGNPVYSPSAVISGKRKRLGTFDNPADAYKVFYEHHLANGYDVSMLPIPERHDG